jgi:transaldolase
MNRESNKFDRISNIYFQFSEKNRENLVKTAKSLLKIQKANEAMLVKKPLISPSLGACGTLRNSYNERRNSTHFEVPLGVCGEYFGDKSPKC